jgi:hypothetical protein
MLVAVVPPVVNARTMLLFNEEKSRRRAIMMHNMTTPRSDRVIHPLVPGSAAADEMAGQESIVGKGQNRRPSKAVPDVFFTREVTAGQGESHYYRAIRCLLESL